MRTATSVTDLNRLTRHLWRNFGFESALDIGIVWCPEQERYNNRNYRGFCHAREQSQMIHCARALDALPEANRIGILLHECGHILQHAFGGDESEVDVDVWCVQIDPGYDYSEKVYYTHPKYKREVIARHIQRCSYTFLANMRLS